MKKLLPASLAFALVISMTGCALGPTKPLSFNQLGQFTVYPLSHQTFRISYKALNDISFAQAQDIALVKAAQTAILNGYPYFVIINGPTNVEDKPQKQVVYPNAWGPNWGWGGGPWGPYGGDPFYGMPQTITTGPAQIAYNIEGFKTEAEAPRRAYNATLILQSIGSQYGVTATGQVLQPQQPTSSK